MNGDKLSTAKRRYAALLRRLAQQPAPISWIDLIGGGVDPMPVCPQGRPPLPADVERALVEMWAAIFLERARTDAAQAAAYAAWVASADAGRAE